LFCGRQGIALRGHKDGGLVRCDEDEICDDGNFKQLLHFRVDAGDQNLQNCCILSIRIILYYTYTLYINNNHNS